MTTKIENNQLVISIPLQSPQASGSGKTLIVASTGGFVRTTTELNGKVISLSINAIVNK